MDDAHIRTVLERNVRAVTLKPAVGRNTARTRVRLKPGLECEVAEGQWTLTVAMSEKSGGTSAGPNPGVLGRGALGSCLALGYAMWAARMGVELDSLAREHGARHLALAIRVGPQPDRTDRLDDNREQAGWGASERARRRGVGPRRERRGVPSDIGCLSGPQRGCR